MSSAKPLPNKLNMNVLFLFSGGGIVKGIFYALVVIQVQTFPIAFRTLHCSVAIDKFREEDL